MSHGTMRTLGATVACTVPLMLAVATVPSATAQTVSDRGVNKQVTRPLDGPIYYDQSRGIHKKYLGTASGDWRHCEYVSKAKYHQTAGCSKGKTVTLGISGTGGFTTGEISTSIGFNVSYAKTVTSSNSVTIKPGGHGWFDVGFHYSKYEITMQTRQCELAPSRHCGSWHGSTTVHVQHHLGDTYHYFGTGAA